MVAGWEEGEEESDIETAGEGGVFSWTMGMFSATVVGPD